MSLSAEELQKKLGYTFKDIGLLKNALRHRSYAYEKYATNAHLRSNERLEFVGDAVIGLIVASYLYERFPDIAEGRMSRIRASVVCEETLSELAVALGVPDAIKLGVGEHRTGGQLKPSILSDAMESIAAAVFVDGGYEAAKTVMLPFFVELIEDRSPQVIVEDHKSKLQEELAAFGDRPIYAIVDEEGPDHLKVFTAEVTSKNREGELKATGKGNSKKEAEQAAAGAYYDLLKSKGLI